MGLMLFEFRIVNARQKGARNSNDYRWCPILHRYKLSNVSAIAHCRLQHDLARFRSCLIRLEHFCCINTCMSSAVELI